MQNGNQIDMSNATLFRSNKVADIFPIDGTKGITLDQGSYLQEMTEGDFLTWDGKKFRGLKADARGSYASQPEPGTERSFRKTGNVRAIKMTEPFTVKSLDSEQPAECQTGWWLVINCDEDGNISNNDDRYHIPEGKFEYEEVN